MVPRKLRTELHGYSVTWSPFNANVLAVATAQYFGVIGTGQLVIFDTSGPTNVPICVFRTPDGVYDCVWCENRPNQLLSACGDGSISIWEMNRPEPLVVLQEHKAEVYAVDWNLVSKSSFISGSWDHTVRLWDAKLPRPVPVRVFAEHQSCVYSARCSPYRDQIFASASGDCSVKIWDALAPKSALSFRAHEFEVLTCDWNKYNENILITGSVDRSVRIWDLRKPNQPLNSLVGHEFAVRRVKCSPFSETRFLSASYDMSVCYWDYARRDQPIIQRYDHHTEFAVGIDFNMFHQDLFASCSWDESVQIWRFNPNPMIRQ